jgi:hypothetical protein
MLVREEIRCAANFADLIAAIAECRGVCSLKHAERTRPGIAENHEISEAGAPDLLLSVKSFFVSEVKNYLNRRGGEYKHTSTEAQQCPVLLPQAAGLSVTSSPRRLKRASRSWIR